MIQVYVAANIIDAQLVCDWLREERIDAEVHGGYLSGAIGELPADTAISVWIHNLHDEARALELTRVFETERRKTPKNYRCTHCGESVEGNFSLCWKCGNQLSESL